MEAERLEFERLEAERRELERILAEKLEAERLAYEAALAYDREMAQQHTDRLMASWNGVKLSAHRGLVTDVLKGRMNYGGLVITDWNAHGQVAGCSNASCPRAVARSAWRRSTATRRRSRRATRP